MPDHDVHTVPAHRELASTQAASRQAARRQAEARPEVRGRARGEAVLGAHLLHLELLASDMRAGPRQVGSP